MFLNYQEQPLNITRKELNKENKLLTEQNEENTLAFLTLTSQIQSLQKTVMYLSEQLESKQVAEKTETKEKNDQFIGMFKYMRRYRTKDTLFKRLGLFNSGAIRYRIEQFPKIFEDSYRIKTCINPDTKEKRDFLQINPKTIEQAFAKYPNFSKEEKKIVHQWVKEKNLTT